MYPLYSYVNTPSPEILWLMQLMVVRMSDKDSEWAKNIVSLYGVLR